MNREAILGVIAKPMRHLKRCGVNRVAWLVACLHATWFFLAIANMSPPSPGFAKFLEAGGWSSAAMFAGRPFHFHYESLALKILVLCDLPSWLVSAVVAVIQKPFESLLRILFNFHLSFFVSSYIAAGLVFMVSTVQWLLIGYTLSKWLDRRPWGQMLNERLSRNFVALALAILIVTSAVTPVVNTRSRHLGFRHAAISYR